ncbi:UDP-N-acetylglucosamine 2-epimerase (hydrolyzing) [Patescibacteria group bacterium]|nr:UDP-N-acetylglucosamine 2-epimerase (hydrolyzing) [Patescibacteria group bacterium]MBU1922012.1 UDP-N-acetylglucosamine 2-epimerase (hydrolyzing) [Patescibacteria group bacterium]
MSSKRKICFVITSKIHYGRNRLVLNELRNDPDLDLQMIVGASAILSKYGDVLALMKDDGFNCDAKINMSIEGGTPVSMAKTTGLGIIEFSTAFENLDPDVVIVRGDRFEMLAAAIAAAYMNKTIAHIEGGDVSGTIDESVRHAITKLAHIHFCTNEDSRQRVIKLGERPEYVFNVGSPDVEFAALNGQGISNQRITEFSVGGNEVDINQPFLMVVQHPVTTELDKNLENIEKTLATVYELKIPCLWFWPNIDAGTDEVSKGMRRFREIHDPENIRFIKYVLPEEYIALLKKTCCLIGNSSSGIKESSYLGTPVVNIGTRQNGRLRAENVRDVNCDVEEIIKAIKYQVDHGRYLSSGLYYKPDTAKNIVKKLKEIDLYIQKRITI